MEWPSLVLQPFNLLEKTMKNQTRKSRASEKSSLQFFSPILKEMLQMAKFLRKMCPLNSDPTSKALLSLDEINNQTGLNPIEISLLTLSKPINLQHIETLLMNDGIDFTSHIEMWSSFFFFFFFFCFNFHPFYLLFCRLTLTLSLLWPTIFSFGQ